MKKVLIIAYYWGTRVPGLVKYLPEFGWQPTLLTTRLPSDAHPPPELRIIETPYRDALGFWKRLFRLNPSEDARSQIKKRFGVSSKNSLLDFILTGIGGVINYPDADKRWRPLATKVVDEFLRNEKIDILISSSPPVTTHLIAKELKSKHGIPWLADFRDLWSQNHNYSYGPLRRLIDRRLELKTLANADALVTVSQPWADKLSALHKGKVTHAITNGFDPVKVNIPPVKLKAKFTITYTGIIYTEWQDPSKLFASLRDLISNGTMNPDEIEVRFYGSEPGWLGKEIEQYGLSGIVKYYERVPQEVALEKQRESQLLLVLDGEDPREKGVYLGKTFEYLGARRPILATGGSEHDVIDELLIETKAGIHVTNVPDIKKALVVLYQEYKLKGKVAYNGLESEVNKYSHREMARKFAEVLDQVKSNYG